MKKHVVKVLKTDLLNPCVKRFVVKKPAGYHFIPGHATTISINEPKLTNQARPFTFTSVNQSDYLEFIIKIYAERNGVTKRLLEVNAGDELILHEVFGTIRYKGPGLFLAGGMGITPFIAIFRQLELEGQLTGNSLLFANREESDILLKNELKEMLDGNYINVLETTTAPNVEKGFIGSKLLKQYVTGDAKHYYICGPDKFTAIIIKHLLDLGVRQSQIVYEKEQVRPSIRYEMIRDMIQYI